MTQKQAKRALIRALRRATVRQKANMRYHAKRGTGICCGADYGWYSRGGAG